MRHLELHETLTHYWKHGQTDLKSEVVFFLKDDSFWERNKTQPRSFMYIATTHSAVVQVWENHRTLFVAHCSKSRGSFEEAAMVKEFLLYYVNWVSPLKNQTNHCLARKCPFQLIVMGVVKLISRAKGHPKTTLTKLWPISTTYPPQAENLNEFSLLSWSKTYIYCWHSLNHIITSSCQCSFWMTPTVFLGHFSFVQHFYFWHKILLSWEEKLFSKSIVFEIRNWNL